MNPDEWTQYLGILDDAGRAVHRDPGRARPERLLGWKD
jgi:hypothetical protein